MKDGTYFYNADGELEDYAAKWSYGYIVGIKPVSLVPTDGSLFGVWTDPDTRIVYLDSVEHIDAREDALRLARERGELAIYDLRSREVIYVEDGEYACGGGAETGVDWVNELVIHEGDSHWHADAELFNTP